MMLNGPRLRLRPWRGQDAGAFAAMNADPAVMRHFAAPLARDDSDRFLAALMAHQAEHGFCFWAVERQAEPGAIGLCGLMRVPWSARFTPAVEIGWRIAAAEWRQGYAEEAARLTLAAGFGPLGLAGIVGFTVPANEASWRLMTKLGMTPDGDFGHPRLPPGHPLHRHLLYRITREAWVAQRLGREFVNESPSDRIRREKAP